MTNAQQTCRRRLEAISIAESIAMRLRDIGTGLSTDRRTAEEYADMARTLRDIEDRLYRKGEYAPENACPLPPLPLAVITHMKKVSR